MSVKSYSETHFKIGPIDSVLPEKHFHKNLMTRVFGEWLSAILVVRLLKPISDLRIHVTVRSEANLEWHILVKL
jgi:hypothetical protein